VYSFACGCIFVPYEIWIARNEIALRLIWWPPVGVSAFGSVDAGPTDLARMLLVEFALTYGNDWFVIRIELNVGALYRIRSLVTKAWRADRSKRCCSCATRGESGLGG